MPSSRRFSTLTDDGQSGPSTGPKIPAGLITDISSEPPSRSTKSHAARSAMIFRFDERAHITALEVRPIRLDERRLERRLATVNRAAGRRDHHPLDPCIARRPQHAQRAVTSWHNQIVFMLRSMSENRRGHVSSSEDRPHPPFHPLDREVPQPRKRRLARIRSIGYISDK